MAQLRIGLAQVDSTVGDLTGNADVVSSWTQHALEQGCHVVAFPEMVLTGYPPEDLVLRAPFVQASLDALQALAVRLAEEGAGEVAVVVGYCGRTERPAPALGRPAGEPLMQITRPTSAARTSSSSTATRSWSTPCSRTTGRRSPRTK